MAGGEEMKKSIPCSHCGDIINYESEELPAGDAINYGLRELSAGKDDNIPVCDTCYSAKKCYRCEKELQGEELRAPMGDRNGILCDGCHKEKHPDTGYYDDSEEE
jgi:hypothetical protein